MTLIDWGVFLVSVSGSTLLLWLAATLRGLKLTVGGAALLLLVLFAAGVTILNHSQGWIR